MRTRNLVFSVFALLLFTSFAYAQVTGVVVDDFGPVTGATVTVQETGVSTETGDDGAFSIDATVGQNLTIVNPNTLAEKNVAINRRNLGDLVIGDAAIIMEDVVALGYQEKSVEQISSAVAVIGGDELTDLNPSTSIDNMMQGKASGVQVTALNGKPGAVATVRIRGIGSVASGGPTVPLYVIDGIYGTQGDMAALNPNDIESITVLKDAASAAIYGSRGANGVVVITTKSGSSGKAKFSYSSKFGWGEKIDDPYDMMNAAEKLEYERQLYEIGGTSAPYRTGEQRDFLASLGHDWQETLLKQSYNTSHNISARGGNENTNYFASFGYDKNTGIIKALDGFERLAARLNLETQANDRIKLGFNLSGSYNTSQEPRDRNNVQNPFRAMYDYNPYEPLYSVDASGNTLYDEFGQPVWNRTHLGFSIAEALRTNPEEQRDLTLFGNIFGEINIMDGLDLTSRISTRYRRYQSEYYNQPGSILDSYVGDPTAPGSKSDRGSDVFSYTWYNGLGYNKTFNELHNFGVLLFTEYTDENYYYTSLGSKGYASPIFTTQENGTTPETAYSERSKYKTFGYAGVLDYSYDDRYILSGSLRRDTSSRFGINNRWGTFWSVSGAWNVTNEPFMEDLEYFDRLKIRGSYGTRGNDFFSDVGYIDRNLISLTVMNTGSYNGATSYLFPIQVGNEDLGWEKVKSTNLGVEFQMAKRRVTGGVDLFKDVRDDFLFNQDYSYAAGGDSSYINAGALENKGVEVELSVDVLQTQDFNWNVYGNISFIEPVVKDLNGQDEVVSTFYTRLRLDEEPFTYFLVRYAGVDPANGDALYYTADGSITNEYNSRNAVLLEGKSPNADYYGGFGTVISYKGIELSSTFNFQHGNYIYNIMASNMLSDGENVTDNQRADAFNYWRNPGDTNVLPAPGRNTSQDSDRWLQDGSYLRWRSLSIAYNFNPDFLSQLPIDGVKVYGTVQNLMTWTDYEGDPEIGYGSDESQGTDTNFVPGEFSLYSYPAQRTFLLGIDVSF